MARANSANDISALVNDFVQRLAVAVNAEAARRTQAQVLAALGVPATRGPGRPPKNGVVFAGVVRRKGPKQLCPVPGCKNPAAPVFGMVCAKHKDVPKAKIKEYREARRQAKQKSARQAA
jgi:hypothetical protein